MTTIDLSRLPTPDVVEVLDFQALLAEYVALAGAICPALLELVPADPAMKLLEIFAYREGLIRARVNSAALATMLATAIGTDLDHIGAWDDVERLDDEADDAFRRRVLERRAARSAAGPEVAYRFYARSASSEVRDVHVDSPEPGVVCITVLGNDGDGTPSSEVLAAVAAVCGAGDVRVLSDVVQVQAATVVTYEVNAGLVVLPGIDASIVLAASIAATTQAVAELHRLGRDVMRTELFSKLHQPGCHSVVLTSPAADIICPPQGAAWCVAVNVSIVGVDT